MLLYNATKCTQIIDIPNVIFPVFVYQGMVFESSTYKNVNMQNFKKFSYEDFKNKELISFIRKYALGDLIQLVPVLREFKKFYNAKTIRVFTSSSYVNSLAHLFTDIIWSHESSLPHVDSQLTYLLDGVLERDHNLNNSESKKHRIEIFFENLGMKYDNQVLNWYPTRTSKINKLPESKMKTIGLQIRGSGTMKTLPSSVIKKIAETLSKKYRVALLDHSADMGFEGKNIVNLCGKLSVPQCVAFLEMIDAVITMDSGMLWLAHAAKCPTLTILGPTRESERISLHPLYPNKAKAINIATELIGCSPCFETKTNCNGKINCMNNFDSDILVQKIEEKLFEILEQ